MPVEKEYYQKFIQESRDLFEMANIEQEDTGLSVVVYVSPAQGNHGPRIKFMNDYGSAYDFDNAIPMTISDVPEISVSFKPKIKSKDIQLIKRWVILNKDILLDYWNHKVTTKQMINSVERV